MESLFFQDLAFNTNTNPHSFKILYVDFFIQLFPVIKIAFFNLQFD